MEGEQLCVMDPCALSVGHHYEYTEICICRCTFCDSMGMSQTRNTTLENKKSYIQKYLLDTHDIKRNLELYRCMIILSCPIL